METKHTPGPWTAHGIPNRILNHNRGFEIRGFETSRSVRDVLPTEIEANAKLIAAAPDLLEALIKAREFCISRGMDINSDFFIKMTETIKKATE